MNENDILEIIKKHPNGITRSKVIPKAEGRKRTYYQMWQPMFDNLERDNKIHRKNKNTRIQVFFFGPEKEPTTTAPAKPTHPQKPPRVERFFPTEIYKQGW